MNTNMGVGNQDPIEPVVSATRRRSTRRRPNPPPSNQLLPAPGRLTRRRLNQETTNPPPSINSENQETTNPPLENENIVYEYYQQEHPDDLTDQELNLAYDLAMSTLQIGSPNTNQPNQMLEHGRPEGYETDPGEEYVEWWGEEDTRCPTPESPRRTCWYSPRSDGRDSDRSVSPPPFFLGDWP
ncbi:hypothetical protein Hanom_Chr10g00927141 [Helianthus anomalus]